MTGRGPSQARGHAWSRIRASRSRCGRCQEKPRWVGEDPCRSDPRRDRVRPEIWVLVGAIFGRGFVVALAVWVRVRVLRVRVLRVRVRVRGRARVVARVEVVVRIGIVVVCNVGIWLARKDAEAVGIRFQGGPMRIPLAAVIVAVCDVPGWGCSSSGSTSSETTFTFPSSSGFHDRSWSESGSRSCALAHSGFSQQLRSASGKAEVGR
jgi:hypothetical protein